MNEPVFVSRPTWPDVSGSVNGIFKGGGAKGLLYAGAVRALYQQGHWFRAVTGSSAGAISATLIAAGCTPDELDAAVPDALKSLRRNWLGDIIGRPFIVTEGLSKWIEDKLSNQVTTFAGSRSVNGPVTFRELYEATNIELHVVCVDIAQRQPIIFNYKSSPDLSVASAVVASSSIPLAFRPGRLRVTKDGTEAVHRLMDGGVWANYPAFVFKDPSFRAHHGLPPVSTDSITVGFTVEEGPASAPPVPEQFLTKWVDSGGDSGATLKGWLRFAPLRIYLLTLVPIVVAIQAVWTIHRYGLLFLKDTVRGSSAPGFVQSAAGFFDGFFSSFWPGVASLIIFMVALAFALLLMGATFLDSGVPAMRALMAVGTSVPYWVGTTSGDHVVRLDVPEGLSTFSFKLDSEKISAFVEEARNQATGQLLRILDEELDRP